MRDELKSRVFVIGPKETPEILRRALGKKWEEIGESLADECFGGTVDIWGHEQLQHNEPDRLRLIQSVRSILFDK